MARFAWELRQLRTHAGAPSYRVLAQRAHYAASTLAEATKGSRLPTLDVAVALAEACGGDREEWAARWHAAAARGRAEARHARGMPQPAGPTARRCPYPGPRPFTGDDAPYFFGREEPVRRLVRLVTAGETPGPVLLTGPSGSGKTSLLHAGLPPALGADWHHLALTPSRDPLAELARQIGALRSDVQPQALREEFTRTPGALHRTLSALLPCRSSRTRVLVTVDALDDAFFRSVPAAERDAFLDQLARVARAGDDRLRVVLALRSDAPLPGLPAEGAARVRLEPLRAEEVRRAVLGPAEAAGLAVEPALLDALLTDLAGRPGAPALLSDALHHTWTRRTGDVLRLSDHLSAGDVGARVAEGAERAYAAATPDERRLLRALFLRLTALGDGTDDTPRRVDRGELVGLAPRDDLDRLLGELADARLVVLDASTAEPAHPALVTAWPRLRHWLADDREGLRTHRRLTLASAHWHTSGRHPGALDRGARLATARSWARRQPDDLSTRERAFLTASRAAERRRRWAVVLLVALATVLAALAGALALHALLADPDAPADRRGGSHAVTHAIGARLVDAAPAQPAPDDSPTDPRQTA
ncbi:helix-turn-helix domain-containing protein [Streptomyces galbus]|uniref:HTH cro/C1-type domain-containing protein n=1 Tax=Streptomyces galbus TaxID=33898 RepID=A0A4U5W7D4_STRGB|nr:helix-turn-helix domain-containing protein [Streptomyces galbus]TKS97457.1 hypothetical protein E4U92_32905 [Streptomyces galbus]GHD41867.1 hypothetical protein GCM10010335_44100 [Streptomyces galbus]